VWRARAWARFGALWVDLWARIDPRAYLGALATYARAHGEIRSEAGVSRLEPETQTAVLENGERISAGEICVAAGWESYQLLQPFMGKLNGGKPIGRGVKGQAILLGFPHKDREPILFHDGAYVIPQKENRVAVGSTSLDAWQGRVYREPDRFDQGNTGFLEKAVALAPILRDAPVMECWAGVRPRNSFEGAGNAPFLGPVPGFEGLSARIGGFKIGLGIGGVKTFNTV
jgi:glycine/D-amino acid oxidase-like deaminating enzyme